MILNRIKFNDNYEFQIAIVEDSVFEIAKYLPLQDIAALGTSCKQLYMFCYNGILDHLQTAWVAKKFPWHWVVLLDRFKMYSDHPKDNQAHCNIYDKMFKIMEYNPSEITIENISGLVIGHLKGIHPEIKRTRRHIIKIRTIQKMIDSIHKRIANT